MHSALALFQLGEFGFVLAMPGLALGLLSQEHYQLFLAVAILGMAATPFIMGRTERLVRWVLLRFLPAGVSERLDRLMRVKREQRKHLDGSLHDHVVIVGFGLNGQNVATAAMESGIACAVIEEDPDLAKKAQQVGLRVLHGDGSNAHVLEQAHVERARVVVIAISDPGSTRKIVSCVRSISSTVYVIVRTRYVREIQANLDAGANEVIPEEFETSIEIFYRVLRKYLVPEQRIRDLVGRIRNDHYGMLRGVASGPEKQPDTLMIPGIEIATLPVTMGRSKVVGRTVEEIQLRERYGITVLAILRKGRYITNVSGNARITTDDVLYLLGSPESIVKLDRDLR